MKEEASLKATPLFDVFGKQHNRVLLPFLFKKRIYGTREKVTVDNFEGFINWVNPRLAVPMSLEETEATYKDLITFIDNEVMEKSIYNEEWNAKRGKIINR